ncbi:hypothetical protein, partial [Croceitalea sp. MTPC5]|uniref:hypothetical protein n=1 Tax=Croceitalea sp. MTPC5 TaxID=3056565 RepID=UPI0030CD6734
MNTDENIKTAQAKPDGYTLLGNVVFSKELFIKTINEIEKQHRHDIKCSEAFRVILPNDYISNYANHWLQNQLVKVLQLAMNDNHKYSWIEYYMWELDFGLKYSKGCVEIKGNDFELKSASDLWDLLNVA